MDARLQRRVQRYGWDKAASLYEGYWAEQLKPAQDLLMRTAVLTRGERVLDVACGTGLVTFRAAEAVGPEGSVAATDISEKMIERVGEDAARRGFANITTHRSDAEELDYDDSTFDVALCSLGLMYVADPAQSIREMLRVTRDGGRLVIAVWGARRNCGWAEIFPIVEKRIASEVCPLFFQLGTGEALKMTMEMAGARDVAVERISTTLEYETADQACLAAFAGGPVALAWSRFDETMKEEAADEYLASIGSFRVGEKFSIPGEFVIASAVKRD
jgi:ubiquinone/menaquinone biosynthesis C-methylase UbiE